MKTAESTAELYIVSSSPTSMQSHGPPQETKVKNMVVPSTLPSMAFKLLLLLTQSSSGRTMMLMVQVSRKLTRARSIMMKTPTLSARLVLPLLPLTDCRMYGRNVCRESLTKPRCGKFLMLRMKKLRLNTSGRRMKSKLGN